ncbi:hypothetical protein DL771_012116 [Monosporascus sp. 5C6A]|nr:hypothetical protein DL771_012116 [Monosporascus sp. 5C6A]
MPPITGLLPHVYKTPSILTTEGGVIYNDIILTLTREGAPGPFVARSGDNYYLMFTVGERIEIQRSNKFRDLDNPAGRHVIWYRIRHQLAKPSLVRDEFSKFEQLRKTPPDDTDNSWAIDGTVFALDDSLYLVYSGWPLDRSATGSELVQELFIARMESPTSVDGPPVSISRPDQEWEITRGANGAHGVNEGPQFLAAPDGS